MQRSFAAFRMTAYRWRVILSEAKDLLAGSKRLRRRYSFSPVKLKPAVTTFSGSWLYMVLMDW